MPELPTYPGVYIEELPGGARPIAGVSSSHTAFVDFFARGPLDTPVRIDSFDEFMRRFGGLHRLSEASYAIRQFFLNGGSAAWVVRVATTGATGAKTASADLRAGGAAALKLEAANPGDWGNSLEIRVEQIGADRFNLLVREGGIAGQEEIIRNLSMQVADPRYAPPTIDRESVLVTAKAQPGASGARPDQTTTFSPLTQGSDGDLPGTQAWQTAAVSAPAGQFPLFERGWRSLETIAPEIFNLLCLPAVAKLSATPLKNDYKTVMDGARAFCSARRAFLIMDAPESAERNWEVNPSATLSGGAIPSPDAAIYFPNVSITDPLAEGRPRTIGPSGTIAGIFARTDARRGVWKAPAGIEAGMVGATPTLQLTDKQNGRLNTLGINVLRTFPLYSSVVWGARTTTGADQQASQWKYVSVRRMALYIEESLAQGLKWAVFEPNAEPLWADLRLNVGAFMQDLFRQGAFQGITPRQAYLVRCDSATTTQYDIDRGIVNILVGFAPLKPAEFVVVKIQQLAGQNEA